jgi:TolB-like protein/DNA-binding SARP family transcriptional activator
MFSLKLLGGASVERSGVPVTGRAARGHRLALLALLAPGRVLSRDKLLALLWPEEDTDRGRRLLSDTLYLIRGTLGEDAIVASGDELRLNPARLSSDVGEFERLLDARQPESAIALYGGPFLDGFHLAETAEFEAWADGERRRLAGRYATALETIAGECEAERRWEDAAGWWRRRAIAEPGNGRVALRFMLALEAAGDRAGALQHSRVHAALLREEYDAAPDPEIVSLTERLRREPAVRASHAAAPGEPATERLPEPATGRLPEPAPGRLPQLATARLPELSTGRLPPPATRGRLRSARTRRAIAAAVAALALAAALIARPWSPDAVAGSKTPRAPRSIAVLPFTNLSAEPERDYFSEGLTEELIGRLSRIEGLRVAARTSSFALGGGGLDVRAIGDTLGVASVLEGSVRRDGGRLRVSARLADAESGYQLWARDYDSEIEDVFAVQDEIARAIATALELELGGTAGLTARRPTTVEAHDLYLRGVFVRNQLTNDGLSKAVDYFDRAIQLDSGYALAHAGKATAIAPLVWYRHLPRAQGLRAMRAAARRALALDETLGEAHVAQGMLEFYFEWNWAAAEREFRRAVALNPSDQHAHHMYANYLVAMGRMDEAIAERIRALELDPLSSRSGFLLGRDYFAAGRYDEAIEQYRRAMEIDSTSPLALGTGQEGSFGLGDVLARQGRDADALAEYLRMARLEGIPAEELDRLRQAFAASGLRGYWRERLDVELRAAGPGPEPLRIASFHARIGDADQAAEWVERAYEERSMALPFLGVLPFYEGVRGHPGIAAVIQRMGLPRGVASDAGSGNPSRPVP